MNVINFENKNEVAAAVENFKRNLDYILEYVAMEAKLRRAKYEALIDAGFTDDQAIRICANAPIV